MIQNHKIKDLNMPINSQIMFSNYKNVLKKRIERRQTKLLKKLFYLKPFLKDNEEIRLITTGCSPFSLMEQYTGGLFSFFIKKAIFVFTNKRIFYIPTTINLSYKNSISQISYNNCKSIEIKNKNLIVSYNKGKKEIFPYIAGQDKKKIKCLLNEISFTESNNESKVENKARVHLCPNCTNELKDNEYRCLRCNLEFKNKKTGKNLSIILPGGGYFYTNHLFLGISDVIAQISLIALIVFTFISFLHHAANISILIYFCILLTLEKFISIYHSTNFVKEYIPKASMLAKVTRP